MRWLDHRVPPPVVALLIGYGMWWLARVSARVPMDRSARVVIGVVLAVIGVSLAVAGWLTFRRAKTTIDPHKPEEASALVTGGIYRYTRNPMYLGLAFALLGWTVYLAAPWTLIGVPVLVSFITRFQIVPEERALGRKFGPGFEAYRREVRRWL